MAGAPVPAARDGDPKPPPRDREGVLITPYRDGPLIVRGRFRLLDSDGHAIGDGRSPIALCRCGHSRAKPFCDGTHKLTGFTT